MPFSNGEVIIIETVDAYSMYDNFPVTNGHSLIIPKRHYASYFDLKSMEQKSCWNFANELKNILTKAYHPDGFTIHANLNEAAGQSLPHVHLHIIPRYKSKSIEQSQTDTNTH